MSFDLRQSLRTLKPQKRTDRLTRRPDSELCWAAEEIWVGGALLLDTSVYLDVLRGRSPKSVDELLAMRVCHHSSVCLAELTHIFGRLDPAHTATKAVLRKVSDAIEAIPRHRLHAPSAATWGMAGMLAGQLVRLSGLPKGEGHERRFLNDALICLQARLLGFSVLTGNVRDFDYLNQLVPSARFVVYRQSA